AHLTGMRADYRLIKRRRNTVPQTSLGKKERSLNLKGAFTASKRAVGRKIVILDDVATTGVTLRLCAHALINQGASEVIALALAHGR
ncbi:MAG: ComF family protein, partial [Elusimicrobia bacterium]|nr:ComF family protein [Elusimicrobiota bacterium]